MAFRRSAEILGVAARSTIARATVQPAPSERQAALAPRATMTVDDLVRARPLPWWDDEVDVAAAKPIERMVGCGPDPSADLLCQLDDDPLRAADVAEPVA